MAIPEKKRSALIKEWGIDPELLNTLEKQNENDANAAKEQGRESKEATESNAEGSVETEDKDKNETETETQPENAAEQADQSKESTDGEPSKDDGFDKSPTRREIADAFGGVFAEFKEVIESVVSRMESLENTVKEIKDGENDKIEKAIRDIPPASLSALLAHRIVGNREAAVDGRSTLAKSKPKEADDAEEHRIGIPFIDRMVNNKE